MPTLSSWDTQRLFQGLQPVPTDEDIASLVSAEGERLRGQMANADTAKQLNQPVTTLAQAVDTSQVGKPNEQGVYTNASLGQVTPSFTPAAGTVTSTVPSTLGEMAGYRMIGQRDNFEDARLANDRLVNFLNDAVKYRQENPGKPSPYRRSTALALGTAAEEQTRLGTAKSAAETNQYHALNLADYQRGMIANKEEANAIKAQTEQMKAEHFHEKLQNALEIAGLKSNKKTNLDEELGIIDKMIAGDPTAAKRFEALRRLRGGLTRMEKSGLDDEGDINPIYSPSHPEVKGWLEKGKTLDQIKKAIQGRGYQWQD